MSNKKLQVSLLDYGAGNVRSVRNAITQLGYTIHDISTTSDIENADVIIFPGVGSYESAMNVLIERDYVDSLTKYLEVDKKPYLGICLGMQLLFRSSEEIHSDDDDDEEKKVDGLGIIPGNVVKFDESKMSVPHIGWNGVIRHRSSPVFRYFKSDASEAGAAGVGEEVYFVHSYYAPVFEDEAKCNEWILTTTTHGDGENSKNFISSIQNGNVVATQFHPEKSGSVGLNFLKGFLESVENGTLSQTKLQTVPPQTRTKLVKRVVVALDVRTNDDGDLVVTKGDQYDVRENKEEEQKDTTTTSSSSNTTKRRVRNLGKPVSLAKRYYDEGADEIAFLNITSFRQGVIDDMPMLQVLEESSRGIYVPLTVGGGIRKYEDPISGQVYTALEVASRYFRAGADKVSIGSDAVYAAENYIKAGHKLSGESSIEAISKVYGNQAVVISIDPKRVYLQDKSKVDTNYISVIELSDTDGFGPNDERFCWYQCTVKGGRETRPICAVTLAKCAENLGAGEIMLNCIDMDGQCKGFDHLLMKAVKDAVTIPVIASSGAGSAGHFGDVFKVTDVEAALAAGMFHRKEVEIEDVKKYLQEKGIASRRTT